MLWELCEFCATEFKQRLVIKFLDVLMHISVFIIKFDCSEMVARVNPSANFFPFFCYHRLNDVR